MPSPDHTVDMMCGLGMGDDIDTAPHDLTLAAPPGRGFHPEASICARHARVMTSTQTRGSVAHRLWATAGTCYNVARGINAASCRNGQDGRMSFCAAMNVIATVESASRLNKSGS